MSKITPEVVNIIYKYLQTSPLMLDAKKPTGNLCKKTRPQNSNLEDVVIDSLGLNRDAVQKGIFLINIFVPNLNPDQIPQLNGDRSQPDTGRLLYLGKLLDESISGEVWEESGDYVFQIQQDDTFEDTNNQHYQSFRIEFYSINI